MNHPDGPCFYCGDPITVASIPRTAASAVVIQRRACHFCAHEKNAQCFFVVYDDETEGAASARHMQFCNEKHEQLRGRRFDQPFVAA
jgi:hypothetical protein